PPSAWPLTSAAAPRTATAPSTSTFTSGDRIVAAIGAKYVTRAGRLRNPAAYGASSEHSGQLMPGAHPELRVDAGQVGGHGPRRDGELRGDLRVGAAGRREHGDLLLAGREDAACL